MFSLKQFFFSIDEKAMVLKLCDFGLARHLDATATTTTRGSLPWMAPEVMKNHKVSKPGDVYSLATAIWEMCTRKIPYEGLDMVQIPAQVSIRDNTACPNKNLTIFARKI